MFRHLKKDEKRDPTFGKVEDKDGGGHIDQLIE